MRLVILALYLMLTLSLSACDWFDDDDDENTGGSGTTAVHTPVETTSTEATTESTEEASETVTVDTSGVAYTKNFHHWNPRSWDGRGSSLVLCPGAPKFDSCNLEGRELRLHGNRDYGRWIWTDYNTKGLSGKITCYDGENVVGFEASSTGSLEYGDC